MTQKLLLISKTKENKQNISGTTKYYLIYKQKINLANDIPGAKIIGIFHSAVSNHLCLYTFIYKYHAYSLVVQTLSIDQLINMNIRE